MSLHISFDNFQKMVDKECIKRTGLTLLDFPTVWCEDFWLQDLEEEMTVHDANQALEKCLDCIINTLGNKYGICP